MSADLSPTRTAAIVLLVIAMVAALAAALATPFLSWLDRPGFSAADLQMPMEWTHDGVSYRADFAIGGWCGLQVTTEVLSPPERKAESREWSLIMRELGDATLLVAPEAPMGLPAALVTRSRRGEEFVHTCRTGAGDTCAPSERGSAIIPIPAELTEHAQAILDDLHAQIRHCRSAT
ncbi:hypothetical protein [Vannielia litorea]|uniref:hypothetical protein n=1 Tax=Vannielia litorea TaxID=1217970 RepID=UPI001C98A0E8|nr:hypothetical protein [Vannielia litorea]MBY6047313.1 hypothetical protein [Vannielia litorea]MBY6074727.1 hypothetical protein [Vannielia litorea]